MKQLCAAALILICFSCGTDTSEIGVNFFREGALDISYTDTATVKLSTIRLDKLTTSSSGSMLVGSSNDTKLGRISAASFVQFGAAANDLEESNVSYDYFSLTLSYSDYFQYDTTKLLTLNAHRLTTTLEADDDGALYTTTTFPFQLEAIGTASFKPHPTKDETVEIRLNDTLGQEFFTKATQGDETLITATDFQKYFKGIVILPDTTTSASVIGFSATPELRLYYWDKSVVPAEQKYLSFSASGKYFTRITTANSNSALTDLDTRARLSSVFTNDESYIQGGAGLALRVDIPYLREMKQLENFYVTRAQLDVYVVRNSYDNTQPLASSLVSYHVNEKNTVSSTSLPSAILEEDADLERYTRYTLDATTFVKSQMETQTLNENALLFMISGLSSSVNRICFASPSYTYKTKLRIYYATVNTTN